MKIRTQQQQWLGSKAFICPITKQQEQTIISEKTWRQLISSAPHSKTMLLLWNKTFWYWWTNHLTNKIKGMNITSLWILMVRVKISTLTVVLLAVFYTYISTSWHFFLLCDHHQDPVVVASWATFTKTKQNRYTVSIKKMIIVYYIFSHKMVVFARLLQELKHNLLKRQWCSFVYIISL